MKSIGVLSLAAASFLLSAPAVQAQDDLREFSSFAPAASAPPRGVPVDPLVWERISRPPDRFGPHRPTEADLALLAAARQDDWRVVIDLVKRGEAHVNARDERGGSVLVLASGAGADDVVRLLLQRGADLERLGEDGFTPLGAAAFRGHRSTVRILTRAGANLYRPGATGQTPMHLAAMTGRTEVIDELLKAGADPRRRNRDGDNALDVAANRGQLEAMDRLMAAGLDPADSGR